MDTYCVSCHGSTVRAGGVGLAGVQLETMGNDAETWEKAVRKLRGRQMPPPGSRQPDQVEVDLLVAEIEGALDSAAQNHPVAGHVPMQRPLIKTANWLNHLEYDWDSPIWRHIFRGLAKDHRFIRYDPRGNGLSDWDVPEFSFEALVQDLESVVEAAGVERFPLLGISQGCAISIEYVIRNPGRVTRLILHGGYAAGWRASADPAEIARREAMQTLILHGWGQNNPAFRQAFTSAFIPEGTPEQFQWMNELLRVCVSPENATSARIPTELLLPKESRPEAVACARLHPPEERDDGKHDV